jgi:translocation protein SEC62
LQSPAYAKVKGVKKVTSDEEAIQFMQTASIIFFVRVARGHSISSSGPQGVKGPSMKVLEIDQKQLFEPDQYYVWFLAPSQLKTILGGALMVAVILAGVMFPLWPMKLRIGVWYLSMAMLGVIALFFGLAIFRLIFWVITIVVAKPGIWLFPNLFADVGFVSLNTFEHGFSGSVLMPCLFIGGQLHPRLGVGRSSTKEEEEGEPY